jgi:hypothetical protein
MQRWNSFDANFLCRVAQKILTAECAEDSAKDAEKSKIKESAVKSTLMKRQPRRDRRRQC